MKNEYDDEYDDTYKVMEENRQVFDNQEDIDDLEGSDDDRNVPTRPGVKPRTNNSTINNSYKDRNV
jgi:hypothetical protein